MSAQSSPIAPSQSDTNAFWLTECSTWDERHPVVAAAELVMMSPARTASDRSDDALACLDVIPADAHAEHQDWPSFLWKVGQEAFGASTDNVAPQGGDRELVSMPSPLPVQIFFAMQLDRVPDQRAEAEGTIPVSNRAAHGRVRLAAGQNQADTWLAL